MNVRWIFLKMADNSFLCMTFEGRIEAAEKPFSSDKRKELLEV